MNDWRPVLGGFFEVSADGQLRRTATKRIQKQHLNRTGYYFVHTSCAGKRKNTETHVLVAEAFIGPRPPGLDVNHKNLIKIDNRAENLEYVTRRENLAHRQRLRPYLRNRKISKDCHLTKLSDAQACAVAALYRAGMKNKTIARIYGITTVLPRMYVKKGVRDAVNRELVPMLEGL